MTKPVNRHVDSDSLWRRIASDLAKDGAPGGECLVERGPLDRVGRGENAIADLNPAPFAKAGEDDGACGPGQCRLHPAAHERHAPIVSNPRSLLLQSLTQPVRRAGKTDAFENRKGPAHDQGDLAAAQGGEIALPDRPHPTVRRHRPRERFASVLLIPAALAAPWPLHTRPENLAEPVDGDCAPEKDDLQSIS